MRIPSGVTDQYIYFVAVDPTDFTTRETGLTTFTVYRARNGAAAAVMTPPTIAEVDATNMPGVYTLLLDEDMTIEASNDSEQMIFHITQASMAPVSTSIELYRPKITAGETLVVSSGAVSDVTLVATTTTNTDMVGTDGAALATVCTEARLSELDEATAGKMANQVDVIQTDTTTDIPANIAALNDISAAQVNAEVLDVLNTDTFAEPAQGAPATTTTLVDKIGMLYKTLINKKTSTASLINIYDAAGTTVDHKRDLSDDLTTYTEDEIVTGP